MVAWLEPNIIGIMASASYNVPIDGHVCGLGRIRHREFAMGVGETSSLEFRTFLEHTLGPAADRCRDGAIAFVCMDWRHAEELITAGKNVFAELKNLCVWNKTNAGMRMKGDSVSLHQERCPNTGDRAPGA